MINVVDRSEFLRIRITEVCGRIDNVNFNLSGSGSLQRIGDCRS
jgi:hypothetical protein